VLPVNPSVLIGEAIMEVSYTLRKVGEQIWPALREVLAIKLEARTSYRVIKLAKPFREKMVELDEQQKALKEKYGIVLDAKLDQKDKVDAANKELALLLDEVEKFDITPVELPEECAISGSALWELEGLISIHGVAPEPTLAK
jgi:hypothetical protein